jgi:hypothetical protein
MDEKELEALKKDAAAKMQAFQEALRAVTESGQKLFAGLWSDAATGAHQRLFEAYSKTRDDMEEAVRLMHEKALEQAHIPKDNPAWKWARKK